MGYLAGLRLDSRTIHVVRSWSRGVNLLFQLFGYRGPTASPQENLSKIAVK